MGSDKLDTFATATASALRSQLKSSIIPPEKTSHKARNVARALSFSKSSWNSWREIRLAVGEKTFKPLAKSGNQWVSRIIFGDLTKKRGNKLIFNSEAYQTNACTSLISQDGRRNKAKCVCVCLISMGVMRLVPAKSCLQWAWSFENLYVSIKEYDPKDTQSKGCSTEEPSVLWFNLGFPQ